MVVRFGLALCGPWRYPVLFRECGMIGLAGNEWQSLHHFTGGGQVEDALLSSLPPYE